VPADEVLDTNSETDVLVGLRYFLSIPGTAAGVMKEFR
jgi:hypothetical protein